MSVVSIFGAEISVSDYGEDDQLLLKVVHQSGRQETSKLLDRDNARALLAELQAIVDPEPEPHVYAVGDRVRRNGKPHIWQSDGSVWSGPTESEEGDLGTINYEYGDGRYSVKWDEGRSSCIDPSGFDPYVEPASAGTVTVNVEPVLRPSALESIRKAVRDAIRDGIKEVLE